MPKGRESGMPESEVWQGFFDPAHILDLLDCKQPGNVIEFGCGYGLFTVEAARRSSGTVYALDIEPKMLSATATAADEAAVANVWPDRSDDGLPDSQFSPPIHPSPRPIRPKRARFVPACA